MADTNISPSGINQSQQGNDENGSSKSHPSHSRRRTKTGCLTCRRRRIKCGEERPICGNCIKSKRNCEGYNQRVVFKAPMHGPTSSIPSHSGTLPRTTLRGPFNQHPLPRPAQNPPLPSILPRTQNHDVYTFLPSTQVQGFINNNQSTFGQQVSTEVRIAGEQSRDHHTHEQNVSWQQYQSVDPTPLSNVNDRRTDSLGSTPPAHRSPSNNVYRDQYAGNNSSDNQSTPQETPPSAGDSDSSYWAAANAQPTLQPLSNTASVMGPRLDLGDEMDEDDNDPYDVSDDEDEEIDDAVDGVALHSRALQRRIAESNLQTVMTLQANHERQDTRVRTYHSVIENFGPNMLAAYIPSFRDSPLSDPTAAAIFTHFLNVVAPGISMYERHPANPSLLLQGQPVPRSQQHLWAYTLPTVALRNHGLMHAMLALSSLHIAKLQDKPTWVSLKHYHYAIRKLARNVSLPTRRKQLATLATTLLLGYYEVMSADHSKWCDHLLGSQQLVKHIDFAGMTKFLKQRKRQLAHENAMSVTAQDDKFDLDGEEAEQSTEDEIDENLVGLLMGKKVDYGEMGEVMEDWEMYELGRKAYTQKDLDLYETQRDLFWWFLKQDTIQSILSQNRLFLNYDRWSHCPPRAPIGRRDAVHGTFDHLILLLGRLSDFASRDLKRKKLAAGDAHSRSPKKPTAPLSGSICATNPNNSAAPACSAGSGPPGQQGGPPPGWQGPPPPGSRGPQPPEFGGSLNHDDSAVEAQGGTPLGCPVAAAAAAAEAAQALSIMQGGPPPGWQGPPPPGWTGGPPPGFPGAQNQHVSSGFSRNSSPQGPPNHSQAPLGWQGGPSPGRQGPPPPSWTGPPHVGFRPSSSMPPQGQGGGPPSMPKLPPFAGMLPTGERHWPRGFSPEASSPSAGEDSEGCPDGQRIAAEEEWSEIGRAFTFFRRQLGADFQELGAEYNTPINSPFGPAIQYRGYNIGVIWLMYYMGLIVWHRAHPSQLPSAMVAAGMTAHETGKYANIIGRIAAGIGPDANTANTVAIATGSGLNDAVFSLFVAGVQYQDSAQRQWVIQRMLDTERLTGWETATQVAKGLETAWTKAAEMGRGPPYERYVEPVPVNTIWNRATQRMDRMFESAGDEMHVTSYNTTVSGRAQWAAGIIGIEVGLTRVSINNDENEEEEEG